MSEPIDKEWMSEPDRGNTVYSFGVEAFLKFAEWKLGGEKCRCPCKKCQNRKWFTYKEVGYHLISSGIDKYYRVWTLHGETPSNVAVHPPFVANDIREKASSDVGIGMENPEEEIIGDVGIGMENFVDSAFGLHGDAARGDGSLGINFDEPYVPEPDFGKRYWDYKRKASEKLYPTCEGPETTLSALVELHNVKQEFGWSGNSMTALLTLLRRWLPKGNTLPEKYPVMKGILKDLGMKATCIHACENNCILYWKTNKDLTECPECKAPRFKVNEGSKGRKNSKEPKKVLRHFPLIPRLQRLYTIPWIAHEMTWHARAETSATYIRHPVDSGQWKICKEKWPEFANEQRNVRLAIATDGFNPRGIQSTSYSCWPVITVAYNLPPSMCMKSDFQMLSLLIPGPKAPKGDIDVFLEPLYDELKELWIGVPAYDMHLKEKFNLRAMLMWGIHDFPAYGNLAGCVTHGYKACPICGDDTPSIYLKSSRKNVYLDYRIFLRGNHPFRKGKYLGCKKEELRTPPQRLNGDELLQTLSNVKYIPGQKRKRVHEVTSAWYRKSIFFDLPYWIHHKVRHVIDVMHIEKNVAEHILDTILSKKDKSKDTIQGREDMRELGIHRDQWMQTDVASGKQVKPIAPYCLNKAEKMDFLKTLKNLRLPSGFSSNLSNIVSLDPPAGLLVMKSHDYHVIMQYLLPVLLQHAFPTHPELRRALHQISLFFNLLCSKVVSRREIQDAKYMVVEALCVLEKKYFSVSFFDISIHLIVHLADEALMCGPSHTLWMYPFEQSMKECKDIPSNKRYVEGSIAESYLLRESVRYAMEYIPNSQHKSTGLDFLDENDQYEGPVIEGKDVVLSDVQFVQIRRWLLFRLEVDGLDDHYRCLFFALVFALSLINSHIYILTYLNNL